MRSFRAAARRSRLGWTSAAVVAFAMTLTACGGSSSSTPQSSDSASDSTPAAGGEVVMFMMSSVNNYVASMIKTTTAAFEAAGYTVTTFESNFDQTEQDAQVQQYIASGKKPAGILWWPADNNAAVGSSRRLAQIGVPIVERGPIDASKDYMTAYAGVNDVAIGKTSGESAIQWREWAQSSGLKLKSPAGNVLVMTYPEGSQFGLDRIAGFDEATKAEPFKIVGTIDAGYTTESSFEATSQVWPKLRSEGVDLIYGVSEFPANGAMQVLEEDGLVAGKDFYVISGNCQTNFDLFVAGKTWGTTIQSPVTEGKTIAAVLNRLMVNGGKTQGPGTEEGLAADPDTMPEVSDTPAFYTYMPSPALIGGGTPAENQAKVDGTKLWGDTATYLCSQ